MSQAAAIQLFTDCVVILDITGFELRRGSKGVDSRFDEEDLPK